jgi:hypothetical protein
MMVNKWAAVLSGLVMVGLMSLQWGCEEDSSSGGPVGECATDTAKNPPASGSYSGRFAFSADDPVTFPLSINVDLETLKFSGTLSFSDSKQSFSGTLSGSASASGQVDGTWQATGSATGDVIHGNFHGQMDGNGGCGTWSNEYGQGGPWKVGEPG